MMYIDSENKSLSINGVSGGFDDQMRRFIKCCEALNKSLKFFTGYELNILTNDKPYIESISKSLNCIEIDFELKFPKGIRFFASHQKLSIYKFLSSVDKNEYSFLIDNDIICINKMPINLIKCIDKNIPVYYDITSHHYPAYSRETIITSKELMMPNEDSIGLWAGGEFIGGDRSFFKSLFDEIELLLGNYLKNYENVYHIGSEALTSVAIEKVLNNRYICDAGIFGGIGRYWSNKTRHTQNRWKSYVNVFLLHIPLDKAFISRIEEVDENLVKKYELYLMKVLPLKYIKNIFRKLWTN